jgi:hypothetical protein
MPQLAIPCTPAPTIGSPFNAEALMERYGVLPRRARSPSRAKVAWNESTSGTIRKAKSGAKDEPISEADLEAQMAPLIAMVKQGYVLLEDQLAALKTLAALVDAARESMLPASART